VGPLVRRTRAGLPVRLGRFGGAAVLPPSMPPGMVDAQLPGIIPQRPSVAALAIFLRSKAFSALSGRVGNGMLAGRGNGVLGGHGEDFLRTSSSVSFPFASKAVYFPGTRMTRECPSPSPSPFESAASRRVACGGDLHETIPRSTRESRRPPSGRPKERCPSGLHEPLGRPRREHHLPWDTLSVAGHGATSQR
jgi:hypothetical protein